MYVDSAVCFVSSPVSVPCRAWSLSLLLCGVIEAAVTEAFRFFCRSVWVLSRALYAVSCTVRDIEALRLLYARKYVERVLRVGLGIYSTTFYYYYPTTTFANPFVRKLGRLQGKTACCLVWVLFIPAPPTFPPRGIW
jgi:hypothetical protein